MVFTGKEQMDFQIGKRKTFVFLKKKKSVPVNLPFKDYREVTVVGMCIRPEANLQNVTVLGQPRNTS